MANTRQSTLTDIALKGLKELKPRKRQTGPGRPPEWSAGDDETPTGIVRAIRKAGNQARLGEILGVSDVNVHYWVHRGWVPPRRAVEIEMLLGIPREDLMPPRLREMVTFNTKS